MIKFHQNKYGKLIKCKAFLLGCTVTGEHITESERNLLTELNYSSGKLTAAQNVLYVEHNDAWRTRQEIKSSTTRQYGATREAYDYYNSFAQRFDPFELNGRSGFGIEKEFADDNNCDSSYKENYEFYRSVPHDKYRPNKAHNVELVASYFKHLKKVAIPAGTIIETTRPQDVDKILITSKAKTVKILHLNYGSVGDGHEFENFRHSTVTWLGKNGWLYNVEIDQKVLDAN